MRASVVLGASYGDEAKGATVDFLSTKDTLVVRHSSGPQAGHTVVTPGNRRHVFHHFGSGSFKGAKTFLSQFFLVNPMFFMEELVELQYVNVYPKVIVDPRCLLTVPFDLMLNQAAELSRGEGRHGSCGMGVNECITRSFIAEYQLGFYNVWNETYLAKKLRQIRDEYVPKRKLELGITEDIPYLNDDRIIDRFTSQAAYMRTQVSMESWEEVEPPKHVVFEGAQGLMLDQSHKNFPYVTRANTGLTNVLLLAEQVGIKELDVYYVTRTYATRHGAGPLPHETEVPPYIKIVEETNTFNDWQRAFRYGLLDLDLLAEEVIKDQARAQGTGITVIPHLALTCADQVDDEVRFVHKGQIDYLYVSKFASLLMGLIGANTGLISFGKTRKDIHLISVTPDGMKFHEQPEEILNDQK